MAKCLKIIKDLTICMGIILFTVIIDYVIQDYIYKNKCKLVEDGFLHVFQIDDVEVKANRFVLKGWVFRIGEDSVTDDFDIILYDYNNDKEYYMNVEDTVREDVNEYFLCEYDYSNVGFVADIRVGKLDLGNVNYEVLIRPRDSRNAYKTGTYISKGEMMFVKPEDYVLLDVEGTELEQIVNEGVLRVYRPDVGMYVYQYEESLYWIADEDYYFENDNTTYIPYQLNTTQIDNLPKYRLDNEWYWDNVSFYFEDNEMNCIDTGKYRVAAAALPTEYSITKIWTGYHVESWVWIQNFRPWYDFE